MKRLALLLFAGGVVLMVLALLQGAERNGATRWLILAGAVIQPSEFVKPGFVVLTAWLFSESVKRPDMPALEISLFMLALFLTLLVLQPDMGQAIIAACVWCGMLFLAGYSLWLLPVFAPLGTGGLTAAYFTLPHFTSRLNRFLKGRATTCKLRWRSTLSARRAGLGMALARVSPRRGSRMPITISFSPR